MPVQVPVLEIQAHDNCNLSCESCSHFSNHHFKSSITAQEVDRQFSLWSHKLQPDIFRILGGEPTLNPELDLIVQAARKHFQGNLELVTNGLLIKNYPDDFGQLLATANVRIKVSIHSHEKSYLDRLTPSKDKLQEWTDKYSLKVYYSDSIGSWTQRYKGYGEDVMPFDDQNIQASWDNCPARQCKQLRNGRIYKCPRTAYLPMMAQRYKLNEAWTPYLNDQALEPTATELEIKAFFDLQAEQCCGQCPAQPPPMPNKLITLGLQRPENRV